MFIDEVEVEVQGGEGGDGIIAWRREKYVAFGGPAGGDGGAGGSVILESDENLGTLLDLRYQRHIRAERGHNGGPKGMTGRCGEDHIVRVPVGTQVYDASSDVLLVDLVEHGQRFVAGRGGDGGHGNIHFQTSRNRAPKRATSGYPAEHRKLRLELKLLAEVGIIGYPSVGKSTLITALSNARPRIAAYPFTTLVPNLGMVQWRDELSFAMADIPGLIEGAHEGQGLGHQFLRHVERCRLLLHLIEVPPPFDYGDGIDYSDREPVRDFERICRELELFNPELAEREQIVVLNKADLPFAEAEIERLRAHFEGEGRTFLVISAAGHQGLDALLEVVGPRVLAYREAARAAREASQAQLGLLDISARDVMDLRVVSGEGAAGMGRHTERSGEEV